MYHYELYLLVIAPTGSNERIIECAREVLFPSQSQDDFLIYIGNDVGSIIERSRGVELPASVLANQGMFRREILYRLRRIVGSPQDN